MAQGMKGVPIFSVGRWRGSRGATEVNEAMLDSIIASFDELGKTPGFKPVVKLGHAETLKFFGTDKGAPNLGFIERVWREGEKLMADFANVPKIIVDLIEKGRYNSVSIELFPETEYNGKKFSNVLSAVALLGAELPAVKGIEDLAAFLFTAELPGDRIELQAEKSMFTQEQVDALVEAAVAKAVKAAKDEFAAQITALTADVTAAKAAQATAETSLRTFEADTQKQLSVAAVDKAIEEGKLLPKHKDMALAFMQNVTGKIKFGDKEKSAQALFAEFIDGLAPALSTKEKGAKGKTPVTFDSPGAEVHAKAQEIVDESGGKITYASARTKVLTDDPELKERYFVGA